MKVPPAPRPSGRGRSRPSVQPPAKGSDAHGAAPAAPSGRAPPPPCASPSGTAPAAARRSARARGCGAAPAGVRCRSNSRSRQWRIIFGSGIFTGQTLSHLPQKVEALGRCAVRSMPDQRRRQHAAHRPRIHPAIGVAADRAIDRAVVHAGGAADAAQHLAELGAEHVGAAVVEEDDVVLLRPVEVAGAARAGGEGGVDGEVLPGGAPREQAQQGGRVLQRRHHLLDGGQRDVDARQGLRQVAIALVGDDDAAAGLGDQEIGAGDADIGGEEAVAQLGRAPPP